MSGLAEFAGGGRGGSALTREVRPYIAPPRHLRRDCARSRRGGIIQRVGPTNKTQRALISRRSLHSPALTPQRASRQLGERRARARLPLLLRHARLEEHRLPNCTQNIGISQIICIASPNAPFSKIRF